MQFFENVILAQHRIVELDLSVFFLKFLADLCVRDHRAARDQTTQLINQNVFLYAAFELGYGEIVLLQQFFVGSLADEVAAGEKSLAITAVLQFVAYGLVRRAQAEMFSLSDQGLPLD